jgi:hypothetical protein
MQEKLTYAEARRQAEEALAEIRRCRDNAMVPSHWTLSIAEKALRALLDAAPEDDAYSLHLLRLVAAEGCRDEAGSGVSCREAAIPPDDVCEVCKVIEYLAWIDAAKKEGR